MALSGETFLTLLVAQLKYQDPLGPKDNTEFLTQLAQMNSLEEMQQLNLGMTSIQAYSLVGKFACAEVLDSGSGTKSLYSGPVDSIVSKRGTYYAVIGENAVKVEDIVQVFDPKLLNTDMTLAESSQLIGKTVTGTVAAEDGTAVQVTGVVTGVTALEGLVYASVGGTRIAIGNITNISEQTENNDQDGGTAL
jgi:flagellar basal-body rod modification protein FlgD